ncbi:hypothetical protein DID88_008445 [Monilinia fructigena]|uniref:Small ribosomal subunit protein uS7m n=1 Tax=Monilinia fructigena TaxID=38457 RepID=A0A395J631_9HELO|nr:hypothetical protein DID88_008445 [Monilinia fructigena]
MPPRLNFHSVSRSLTIRSRPIVAIRNPAFFNITPAARRCFAEEKQPPRNGSNEDVAGHVSEEARDIAEIIGETPPDMGKSTNVQDILKRDQEGKDKAPEVTNMMMQHGKKSVAQRNMSYTPSFRAHPHPSHLPLNPVLYLTTAIDSVAPLLRIRSQKGAAGGGASLQIPVPLNVRQRRRQAIKWILDSASKKQSRGSGRGMFAQKVAEEIISVVEGRSTVWEKRVLVHKTGTSARANLTFYSKKRR